MIRKRLFVPLGQLLLLFALLFVLLLFGEQSKLFARWVHQQPSDDALPLMVDGFAARGISDFMLDNGLYGVVIEDHRAPVVVHSLWYKAGSNNEANGASGAAHFLEHMLFKGTERYPAGEFDRAVLRYGGEQNAATSYNYTMYYQRIGVQHLETIMALEADRMRGALLLPQAMDTERNVVLEERNQRLDSNPFALYLQATMAAFYGDNPYGRAIIGSRQDIETLSQQNLDSFYHSFYWPNNAILVVAGDVTPERVRTLAERYYGAIARSSTPLSETARAAGFNVSLHTAVPKSLSTAAQSITYKSPRIVVPLLKRFYPTLPIVRAFAHEQDAAAALTILTELLEDDLLDDLLYDRALVSDINIDLFHTENTATWAFMITVEPKPDISLARVESALDDALAAFAQSDFDAKRVQRIQFNVAALQIYNLDDLLGRVFAFGAALTAKGQSLADVLDWPKRLRRVTIADLEKAAKIFLLSDGVVTSYALGS